MPSSECCSKSFGSFFGFIYTGVQKIVVPTAATLFIVQEITQSSTNPSNNSTGTVETFSNISAILSTLVGLGLSLQHIFSHIVAANKNKTSPCISCMKFFVNTAKAMENETDSDSILYESKV